jgi:hypothetical protein
MLSADFLILKAVSAPLQTSPSHGIGDWQEKNMPHMKEVFLNDKIHLSYRSKQFLI